MPVNVLGCMCRVAARSLADIPGKSPTTRRTRRCGPVTPKAALMRFDVVSSPWATAQCSCMNCSTPGSGAGASFWRRTCIARDRTVRNRLTSKQLYCRDVSSCCYASTDVTSALAPGLIEFIHRCIPTLQAAEVLLFLAAHPDRRFLPDEIVVALQPVVVTPSAVREYADLFLASRLLSEVEGKVGYSPSQPQADQLVQMLSS